ncbi:MAG: FAD-binding protein [Roseobacter sp.]
MESLSAPAAEAIDWLAQQHGNVAYPHGILINWVVITEGGIQVNLTGKRFWNEAQDYSEAAKAVLSQLPCIAFAIFEARISRIADQFESFRAARRVGAVIERPSMDSLATDLGLPVATLPKTVADISWGGTDGFSHQSGATLLEPPFCGVRVTGAQFQMQGGLQSDGQARVLDRSGQPFPNLFAGGLRLAASRAKGTVATCRAKRMKATSYEASSLP